MLMIGTDDIGAITCKGVLQRTSCHTVIGAGGLWCAPVTRLRRSAKLGLILQSLLSRTLVPCFAACCARYSLRRFTQLPSVTRHDADLAVRQGGDKQLEAPDTTVYGLVVYVARHASFIKRHDLCSQHK